MVVCVCVCVCVCVPVAGVVGGGRASGNHTYLSFLSRLCNPVYNLLLHTQSLDVRRFKLKTVLLFDLL